MKNFWENRKVLITGAAGFIGSHVVENLLDKKAVVTAAISPKTDSGHLQEIFGNSLNKMKLKKVDLMDFTACRKIIKGNDIILNFAAMDGGTSFKTQYPALIFRKNSEITLNILESARLEKIEKVLLMSSVVVYSKKTKSPILESENKSELSASESDGYVWSKRFLEIAARMYAKEYNMKIAIARPGNIYGPKDYITGEKARVIPAFIAHALKGEDITIVGDGKQEKQFLFVEDFVEAILKLVENKADCDPVNIASEKVITLRELAELILRVVGGESKITMIPSKSISSTQIVSVMKAKESINFKEKTTLEKGIIETVRYVKKNL